MHATITPMIDCPAGEAHGARFTIDGAAASIAGRRRAALVAALAEADPAGVELFALDVAAIEAAGVVLQPVAAGHYRAAAPIAGISFVRLLHLPAPVAGEAAA